jgi:hypothetical protein
VRHRAEAVLQVIDPPERNGIESEAPQRLQEGGFGGVTIDDGVLEVDCLQPLDDRASLAADFDRRHFACLQSETRRISSGEYSR